MSEAPLSPARLHVLFRAEDAGYEGPQTLVNISPDIADGFAEALGTIFDAEYAIRPALVLEIDAEDYAAICKAQHVARKADELRVQALELTKQVNDVAGKFKL